MRPLRWSALLVGVVAAAALAGIQLPAAAVDDGTGSLRVAVVDALGRPVPGSIALQGGGIVTGALDQSTVTFGDLSPASYRVQSMTYYGGVNCAGMTSCPRGEADGSLQVVAGETTEVTIQVGPPAHVRGEVAVGSRLGVRYSRAMQRLALLPDVTWLRDGKPILGATGTSYAPRRRDVGAQVAARLSWSTPWMGLVDGSPPTPWTSAGVMVPRIATTARAGLADDLIGGGRHGKVQVRVGSDDLIVTGWVEVRVGSWTTVGRLRNGTARAALPPLDPGRHRVHVRYLGSPVFQPAVAESAVLTVRPPR
jgi:hypothetical protein